VGRGNDILDRFFRAAKSKTYGYGSLTSGPVKRAKEKKTNGFEPRSEKKNWTIQERRINFQRFDLEMLGSSGDCDCGQLAGPIAITRRHRCRYFAAATFYRPSRESVAWNNAEGFVRKSKNTVARFIAVPTQSDSRSNRAKTTLSEKVCASVKNRFCALADQLRSMSRGTAVIGAVSVYGFTGGGAESTKLVSRRTNVLKCSEKTDSTSRFLQVEGQAAVTDHNW